MRKMSIFALMFTLIAALALPAGLVSADGHSDSIVDIAVSNDDFSTLVAAVQAAGLVDALAEGGPYTVFAPTNEAFANAFAYLGITAEDLLANPEFLTDILLYHVVPGEVTAAQVVNLDSAPTLNGADISIGAGPTGVQLDGRANVIATDIMADNGVIHVIDTVLFPPASIMGITTDSGIFNTLMAALDYTGLTATLAEDGPYTLFAPTDDAFAASLDALGLTVSDLLADPDLLTSILLYHVVPGNVTAEDVVQLNSARTLNGASISIEVVDGAVVLNDGQAIVTNPDLIGANGVVHMISGVLLPQ